MSGADPYAVLDVSADVTDAELRRAYRALVKRHHPDHNGGSAESTARFAQIQSAYTAILRLRSGSATATARTTSSARPTAVAQPTPADPSMEQRLREMEQEIVRARAEKASADQARADYARETREAALQAAARQQAAYEAVAAAAGRRPTREELGYYSTQDSFSMIVDDATEALGERLRNSEAKRQFARRLTDLFSDGD